MNGLVGDEFWQALARTAAAETLPRFRQGGSIANKLEGGFDPVTEADRAAEQALRSLIAERFPQHGILGEEFGAERPDADYQWVIDPIDGTRSFISGIPLWGTLVGLTQGGRAVAGMMAQPYVGETFVAEAGIARYSGPAGTRPLAVSGIRALEEATLCTTSPTLFPPQGLEPYRRLEARVKLARYGTDCYAYAMLAAGQVDLVVESGLKSYDVCALIAIVEAAGGLMTTWDGGRGEEGGFILAAATPELHRAAMDVLRT
jgi:histidinol phosphatase-like enzyme (inositol monophosphatase family)